MSYQASFDGHVRLAILQLLDSQSDGSANDSVLYEAINAMNMTCSREKLREHIFWLAGQNAVNTLDLRMRSGLVVATLTERGTDVANRRSTIPGIEKPKPKGR